VEVASGVDYQMVVGENSGWVAAISLFLAPPLLEIFFVFRSLSLFISLYHRTAQNFLCLFSLSLSLSLSFNLQKQSSPHV